MFPRRIVTILRRYGYIEKINSRTPTNGASLSFVALQSQRKSAAFWLDGHFVAGYPLPDAIPSFVE